MPSSSHAALASPTSPVRREHWERWSWAGAGIVLVGACIAHARFGYAHPDLTGHAAGVDDAFITFRYAENLLHGHGLVFNEGERVEGFTNLGFLLLCVPGLALFGREGALAWSIAINACAALVAAALVAAWLRRRLPPRLHLVVPWIVALQPALWVAVATGLETGVVVLLQVALWALVDALEGSPSQAQARTTKRALFLVACAAILVRADGFVSVAIATAFLARTRPRVATELGVVAAVACGTVLAFRLSYYGDLLPNTYYAKVSAPFHLRIASALAQLFDVSVMHGFAIELLTLTGAWALARQRGWRLPSPFAAFFGAAILGYWIWVGGDVFQERFLVVLYLIGSALAVACLVVAERERSITANACNWLIAVIVLVHLAPIPFDARFRYTRTRTDRWIALGHFLAHEVPPSTTLAIDAAGKVPFFSGLRTIDMLGLSDRALAHRARDRFDVGHDAYDADYVLARRPDLVATWMEPSLDMHFGLDHARWREAGYELRWLAFSGESDYGRTEIIDAREVPSALLPSLIRAGFHYAVLQRVDR